ncbi:MAG: hypothetical protein HN487_02070 [Flavobacterium sp.]|jgi:hypothetical protein|nr:hypothetical protein [Flavobacterium sp.]
MKIFKNSLIYITFSIIIVIFSCSEDENSNNCVEHSVSECNEDPTKVNIRISNISNYNYCNVVSKNTNFGIIEKEESTCYKSFESAYRYAFVELLIDGNTHTLQPIDYVGETLLEPGYYTYQINANDSQEQYGKLSLTLIED